MNVGKLKHSDFIDHNCGYDCSYDCNTSFKTIQGYRCSLFTVKQYINNECQDLKEKGLSDDYIKDYKAVLNDELKDEKYVSSVNGDTRFFSNLRQLKEWIFTKKYKWS